MNKNQATIKRLDVQQGDFITTNTGHMLRIEKIAYLGWVTGHDENENEYTIEARRIVSNERQ